MAAFRPFSGSSTPVVFGMLIATAAALAFHALKGKTAIAAGAALLMVAICAMHFTAMGAAVIVPDPTIDISHGFSANASMMALAIAGLTVLVILAGLAAALIDHQTMVDNMGQIRELVDAASEGIVIAADGVIVNVNRRITELCGRPLEELVGANVSGDLLHDFASSHRRPNPRPRKRGCRRPTAGPFRSRSYAGNSAPACVETRSMPSAMDVISRCCGSIRCRRR